MTRRAVLASGPRRLGARLVAAVSASALLASALVAGVVAPATPAAAETSVAPIISYDFDADTAGTVVDASGNGNDGTAKGSPGYPAGVSGKGFAVSSGTNYLKLPLIAGKTDGSASFSFEFWANISAISSYGTLFSNQDFAHCYNKGTTLVNKTIGRLQACWPATVGSANTYMVGSNYNSFINPTAINGAWHQIAGTYDVTSGVVTYYVDGVQAAQKTGLTLGDGRLKSGYAFNLGGLSGSESDSADGYTNAVIDDFNFYAAAISASQVAADYAATNPVVTVRDDGHGTGSASPAVAPAGTTVTLTATPAEGYHFAGWTNASEGVVVGSDGTFVSPGGPVAVTATFVGDTYVVDYDGNGADGGGMAEQTLAWGVPTPLASNAFTRTGYRFIGWSTAPEGEVVYADGTSLTEAAASVVRLYAQWAPEGAVRIVAAGDAHLTISSSADDSGGWVLPGTTVTLSCTPAIGYTGALVIGGETVALDSDGTFSFAAPSSDVTIQGVSTANRYTIAYDANGGTGAAPSPQSLAYDESAALLANAFTRAGYAFLGWATTPSGAAVHQDGESVSGLSAANGATVTLYAVWGRLRAVGDAVAPYLSYDFDGTLADASGGGRTATKVGDPAYATGLGGTGKAIRVDGAADTVQLPLISGRTDGSGSFSIVFWYGQESFTGDAWVLSNNTGGSCNVGFNIYNKSSSTLEGCFGTTSGGTKQYQDISTASISGAWHQLAAVVDRTAQTVTWYLDGAQQVTTGSGVLTSASGLVTGLPFTLGQNGALSYQYDAVGWFDDLDFYTSAISAEQVLADYNATRPSSTALPVLPSGGSGGSSTTSGFVTDTFRAPAVRVGGAVSQSIAGLWASGDATGYSVVDGDGWLGVSETGVITGTAPSTVPQHPATITVQATDGAVTEQLTVEVPVIGATEAVPLTAATWNLWDAGSHVDDALAKDLAVIAANGLDVIGVQEDGGTVARSIADALGWHVVESADGLAVVSAYPISSDGVAAATEAAPALGVTVEALGRELRVWDAALDESGTAWSARTAAIAGGPLAADIAAADRVPLVLLGDLGSASAADWLQELGLVDAYAERHASGGGTLAFEDDAAEHRIDFVAYAGGLVSLGSSTLVAGWPSAADPASNAWTSDHKAVTTRFSLGAPTPPATAPDLTVSTPALVLQVGAALPDQAGLAVALGASSTTDGAVIAVDTAGVDVSAAGDYTAIVTATDPADGRVSDPVPVVVHVVPVVALSLGSAAAALTVAAGGTVDTAALLDQLRPRLNVHGGFTVDVSGVDTTRRGDYPVTVTGTDDYGFTSRQPATLTITPVASVAFDANGGTGVMPTQTGETGSETTLGRNAFERPGYTFAGWSTAADGTGESYADGVEVRFTTAVTLYAQWSPIEYAIALDLAGGSAGTPANPIGYTVASAAITLVAPTRTGYAFAGWTGTGLDEPTMTVTIPSGSLGDRAYAATWTANAYTIEFDANGGVGTTAPVPAVYDSAAALSPSGFTRDGYAFAGWSPTADGDAVYADGASVTSLAPSGTVRLYAVWSGNAYTVRFEAEGGSGAMPEVPEVYGTGRALPANAFVRTGYGFAGWSTTAGGPVDLADGAEVSTLTATEGAVVTLHAVWTPNEYRIVFEPAGGTGTTPEATAVTDAPTTLPASGFARTGYRLAGWGTSPDGPVVYADGATVLNATPAGTLTLYAIWTPHRYTVVYDGNGADGGLTTPTAHVYGTASPLAANGFTRAGWVFAGWATSPDGEPLALVGGGVVSLSDVDGATVTLYAAWTMPVVLAVGTASGGSPRAGEPIVVDATGFAPSELVEVVLHSTPVVLGTLAADAHGAVHGSLLVPATTEPGQHHLELTGRSSGVAASSAAFTVLAAASGLAATGTDAAPGLALGLALLLLGLVGLRLRRAAGRRSGR